MISGYVALIDGAKVGRGMTFFARVGIASQDEDAVSAFIAAMHSFPEVIECHLMAGECDFLLRIVLSDIEVYRQFQMHHLGRLKGIISIRTEIPMQRVKQATKIPL